MLVLKMRRGEFTEAELQQFSNLLTDLPEGIRPVLGPARDDQAAILAVPSEAMAAASPAPASPELVLGEVLATTGGLVAIRVTTNDMDESEDPSFSLTAFAIGDQRAVRAMDSLCAVISERIGKDMDPWLYESSRMNEMLADGMQPTDVPAADELNGARVLADSDNRTVAVAIASSGGLLVGDLPKQLSPEKREMADDISSILQENSLVTSEQLVICRQTSRQIARVPDQNALEEMARRGLKCACGRDVLDERVESALTITKHGRGLLEGSWWLSVLVTAELLDLGIPADRILIEQESGGDEMDCFADVSGELVFFELKDKEFNLGNAYSFGAKIGIHRPDHSVIVTSAYVGGDAKEHFEKAQKSAVEDRWTYVGHRPSAARSVAYIEGVAELRSGLEDVVGRIFALDAQRVLREVLPFASLNARSLVAALQSPHPPDQKDSQVAREPLSSAG